MVHFPLLHSIPALKSFSILPVYLAFIFIVALADALLSYVVPVYIEANLGNTLYLGIIMSSSSLFGLMVDIWIGTFGLNQSYRNLLVFGIIALIFFPLTFILFPATPLTFIVAMIMWGLYYEFFHFSNFQFINHYFNHNKHALGWGIISGVLNTAYFIGPLIAGSFILSKFDSISSIFYFPLLLTILTIPLLLLLLSRHKKVTPIKTPRHSVSLPQSYQLAGLLLSKTWPLVMCISALYMLDAAFWTIGILLSESIKSSFPFGGILITVYVLPNVLMAGLIQPLSRLWGKKRVGILAGLIAGSIYASLSLIEQPLLLLGVVFTAGLFQAIAIPELLAAFEDYIDRLESVGNSMVAIESFSASLGYIIGPIVAGTLSLLFSHHQAISFMGVFLAGIAFISLIIVPRKIKLPRSQINKISS